MRFQLNAISALVVGATLSVLSGQALAHQTYNLTGAGIGIGASINNSDGISNTDGYAPVDVGGRVAGAANANVPGTGGLPTDYVGALPYNMYHGHHDNSLVSATTGLPSQTTRNNYTGTSATDSNSLWKAYNTQNASATWGPVVADPAPGAAVENTHPYVAVGGNSWQGGSAAGGLDYNLVHASTGNNNAAQNVTTPSSVVPGGYYQIDFTIQRDAAWNALNDPNALLDVALYRGADSSTTANRTAAFDPTAAGVQGSTLGTGYSELLWSASQTLSTDTLTYALKMDFNEWQKTDLANGVAEDGDAGYYTLIVGAHGGASGSALAYRVDTHSFSVVPIPGAVWLFGTALAGLVSARRRSALVA